MPRQFSIATIIVLSLLADLFVNSACAAWPAKVFAPYMYLGTGDHFKLTRCDDECGQKFYTLAFIISDKSNNPAWYGRIPMEKNLYADQITAIRDRGGDVIVSFGGAAGKEIALVETNIETLQEKYQSVIDRYKFNWLDFDIEGFFQRIGLDQFIPKPVSGEMPRWPDFRRPIPD